MIKTVPAIINVFNVPRRGFSFLVKKGKGDYQVYDMKDYFYTPRELPCKTGDEQTVELFIEVLKDFGAGYKIISPEKVEIFDPAVEEYEDLELPMYQEIKLHNFSYLCDYAVKGVPTKKMVEAAEKYAVKLDKEIERCALLGEIRTEIDCIHDGISTIITTGKTVDSILSEEDLKGYYVRTLNKPYKGRGSYVTLVIDRTLIPEMSKDGVLHIAVPKDWAGIVIGKGGSCTKQMAKDLGLRYIDVKAY